MIFKTINQFIMTSEFTKLAPLTRPSSILCGNQILIYGLNMPHIRFDIIHEDKIQLIQKHLSIINKGIIGFWTLKRVYINKKNIYVNKHEPPNSNLAMTLPKPYTEENY